jgi:hypothetical protein
LLLEDLDPLEPLQNVAARLDLAGSLETTVL